jgi:hypothetical protein
MTTIRQFAKLRSIKNSIKVAAASSIAIGVAAMIPAGDARAVAITTGNLNFASTSGTSDFFGTVNPVTGNSFSVTFSPSSPSYTDVTATGSFAPYFTLPANQKYTATSSPTATFSYNGLVSGINTYKLTSGDLSFGFQGTSTSVSINNNSIFNLNYNNSSQGVSLSSVGASGLITNTAVTTNSVPTQQFVFGFTDLPGTGGGTFSGQVSAQAAQSVPEPFTIIGTIVGGTAAFRMRKKLADINKN